MALDDGDFDKIGQLFESKLDDLREALNAHFRRLEGQMEGLYHRDETREQEYLMIREQLKRHEKRIEALGKSAT